MKTKALPVSLSIIGLGLLLALPQAARADDTPAPAAASAAAPDNNPNMTMYLGNVQVHGQIKITQTLQAIKAGLDTPISTDPKLADVVVCRLEKKVGTHIQETLICGTNRNLARQRYDLQTAMDLAKAHSGPLQDSSAMGLCSSGGCYGEVSDTMNAFIDGMPGHYLYTTVDGTAFRKLIKQVKMPSVVQDSSTEKKPLDGISEQ